MPAPYSDRACWRTLLSTPRTITTVPALCSSRTTRLPPSQPPSKPHATFFAPCHAAPTGGARPHMALPFNMDPRPPTIALLARLRDDDMMPRCPAFAPLFLQPLLSPRNLRPIRIWSPPRRVPASQWSSPCTCPGSTLPLSPAPDAARAGSLSLPGPQYLTVSSGCGPAALKTRGPLSRAHHPDCLYDT